MGLAAIKHSISERYVMSLNRSRIGSGTGSFIKDIQKDSLPSKDVQYLEGDTQKMHYLDMDSQKTPVSSKDGIDPFFLSKACEL